MAKNGVKIEDFEVTPIGNSDVSTIIAGGVECMFTTFAINEPRLIGQAGVEGGIQLLQTELALNMGLAGVPNLKSIDKSLVRIRG